MEVGFAGSGCVGGVGGFEVEAGVFAARSATIASATLFFFVCAAGGAGEAVEDAGAAADREKALPRGCSTISPSLSSSSLGGSRAGAFGGFSFFRNISSLGSFFCGGFLAGSGAAAFGREGRGGFCNSSPSNSASSCSAAVLGFVFLGTDCASGVPSGEDAEVEGIDGGTAKCERISQKHHSEKWLGTHATRPAIVSSIVSCHTRSAQQSRASQG